MATDDNGAAAKGFGVTAENKLAEMPADDFTKTWRYKLGLGIFIFGQVVLVIGLFLPAFGIGAGTTGTLIVGGEVISLSSIAVLGKAGFNAIKAKMFGFIKAGFPDHISRTRHRIGIVLLCTSVVTTSTVMVYAWSAFDAARADPAATVWGLDITGQSSMVFWLFLIGELCFLIAIYTLGGDWWERFRGLFIWKAADEAAR